MTLQALRRPGGPDVRHDGPPPPWRPDLLPRGGGPDAAEGCGSGGVRLLAGPFKRAQEREGRHLLGLAVDALLDAWQIGAGHEWLDRRIADYLSACSLMWAATGEPVYRRRAEHVVGRLAAWLRATGFGAVRALGPLRPGLHDACLHAGSAMARELIGMLGPHVTTAGRHAPATDWAMDRLERVEHTLVNTVLASQQPGGAPPDGSAMPAAAMPVGASGHGNSSQRHDAAGVQETARIGEAIFATDGDVLCVAQYIAAELTWRDKGLRLSQLTAFPERPAVRLIVNAGRAVPLTLRLRHPSWCRVMTVQVNGQPLLESHDAGRWVDVNRCWRNGDVIDVELPMHLHLVPVFPGAGTAMLMYGPMALAAVVPDASDAEPPRMPRLALRNRLVDDAVRRLGSTLRFRAEVPDDDPGLELMPSHQATAGQRALYFELA